jgi:hypothetical protein
LFPGYFVLGGLYVDGEDTSEKAKAQATLAAMDDDLDDYMEKLAKASVVSSTEKFARKKLKVRAVGTT